MNTIPLWRLYLLRAMYLLIVLGLGAVIWPGVLSGRAMHELNQSVISSMLAAFSLAALLGLRYPLQMLPILFWELTWKIIWLLNVALPQWLNGTMDARTAQTAFDCSLVILIPFVIPWGYVIDHYLRKPGDRWYAERSTREA
jgi:hypothetical protein